MRKRFTMLLLGMLALSAPPAANWLWGQAEKKDALPDPAVKVGDMAPDFTLMDTHRNQVSLHDFRGKKNVALAFYIFAFTGGLTEQIQNIHQHLPKLVASPHPIL